MKAQELIANYEITPCGFVINKATKRTLKLDASTGYASVVLSNCGNKKRFLVHRLVAQEYLPNPENKPCVNHKNGIKTDNCVENIEWCTYSENERHSHYVLGKKIVHSDEVKYKMSKIAKGRDMSRASKASPANKKGREASNKKKVILNNKVVFDSITEASLKTGTGIGSIANNLKGLSKSTKIGIWKYYNQGI